MTDHRSSYALDLENGEKHVIVKLYYYIGSANTGWQAQIGKMVSGHWEPIDMTSGKYAMKGPTLEAAFPLEPIKKNLGSTSGSYMVFAQTHYDDDQGNLEAYGDITETKQFAF